MQSTSMLSRSGRTSADGKLLQRLDIPVPEDLYDLATIAASKRGQPKAEFLRELLTDALMDGSWMPLTDAAKRALDALATFHEVPRGQLLLAMVERGLIDRLDMLRTIARERGSAPLDECGMERRE